MYSWIPTDGEVAIPHPNSTPTYPVNVVSTRPINIFFKHVFVPNLHKGILKLLDLIYSTLV